MMKKIFILDDEEDLVSALIPRLEFNGRVEVAAAFDPEVALRKIKAFHPDVVLIDILLPKMDGWEVCRRLRADPDTTNTPLVVMTGLMTKSLMDQAHAVNAKVVTKPLNDREIRMVADTINAAPAPAQARESSLMS